MIPAATATATIARSDEPQALDLTPEAIVEVRSFVSNYGDRRTRSHQLLAEPGWYAWTLADDDGLVAVTAYRPDSEDMDSWTVIRHGTRRAGLGRRLLDCKVRHAQELGIGRYVTTVGGTNAPSINLLTKAGFELVEAQDRDYGTILLFEKELNR